MALALLTHGIFTVKKLEFEESHFYRTGQMLGWTEQEFNKPGLRLFCVAIVLQWLFIVISDMEGIPIFFAFLGTVVAYYAGSCIPRPPSKSTLRKRYEEGLVWLNEKLTEDPSPDPA